MRWLADPALDEFRISARQWLAANVPDQARPTDDFEGRLFDQEWQRRQFDAGWAGVAWPREYGGRGLSPQEQMVWYEELVRARAPGMGCFTVAMGHAGPTIIEFGTQEQKERYLPPILRGESPWCQGFSEPDSGSDLASLSTRGVVEGDHLVINGSKIWTSYAHVAQLQELLLRSDDGSTGHRGLSWVVVPMDSPGLTVRRIPTIDGNARYCQCFYDDVRVPLSNVVGGLGNGWRVAMYTLTIERGMGFLSTRLASLREVDELTAMARAGDRLDDRTAYGLAVARASASAIHALGYDALAGVAPRDVIGGVNRIFDGDLRQLIGRLALDIQDSDALVSNPWTELYLRSRSATISSGTKDIQKNILGERVLGLPR